MSKKYPQPHEYPTVMYKYPRKNRKINKELIYIDHPITNTTQVASVLINITYPCTLVGLRWDLLYSCSSTSDVVVTWCIVKVPDTTSASTMSQTDETSFYRPENDVLTFGITGATSNDGNRGPGLEHVTGSIKTKRKMQVNDDLTFLTKAANTSVSTLRGIIQFFLVV